MVRGRKMTSDITDFRERLARIETTQGHHEKLLERIDGKLDGIGNRVRAVEMTSAAYGSVAGGVMAVAISYIAAKFKALA